MPAIYPVASSRISDSLILARLVSQFDYDQQQLVRLQDQLSTGYRISTPSQDAPAALRAITLQRLLEQKEQARVNLNTTDSFINATDTSLIGANDLLSHVKALALRAVDSTSTADQREILRSEIQNAVDQFIDIGNRQFRGRYLFGGSDSTTSPFERSGSYVAYRSNEASLRNYIDVDFLAETNVTGAAAFGAISAEIQGLGQLTPVLTPETRLADLRGGRGITLGSFLVSDGSSTRTIDISNARTVGDVMELITANAPVGRDLNVTLSGGSLVIDIDDSGGGNLTIHEVPGGSTAAELGIYRPSGVGVAPLIGDPLNPTLTLTTPLRDMLGTRATVRATFVGDHNDLRITAVDNGTSYNNTLVQFTSGGVGDQAIASYNSGTNTLTVQISPGVTRAATAVQAINATGVFTAELDDLDDALNDGSEVLTLASFTTSGGSGETLDQTSGLQIINGGETHLIAIDQAETVEDLLNILNNSPAQLVASINEARDGINVRSRLSGTDFAIGENGGSTATQLGIRSLTRETYLSSLNYGAGVSDRDGDDLTLQRRDGVILQIDLTGAETVGDVLDAINNHPDNSGNQLVARLAVQGNGIELEDANAAGTSPLTVFRGNGFAAWDLGLIPRQQEQASAPAGEPQILTGRDVNPQEVDGVFNSLLRLDQALRDFDQLAVERAAARLDKSFIDITFVQAELGSRANSIATLRERIEREDVEIRATLSGEIDTDMVKVIAELTSRQANLQATLQVIATTSQLTVLNYL